MDGECIKNDMGNRMYRFAYPHGVNKTFKSIEVLFVSKNMNRKHRNCMKFLKFERMAEQFSAVGRV